MNQKKFEVSIALRSLPLVIEENFWFTTPTTVIVWSDFWWKEKLINFKSAATSFLYLLNFLSESYSGVNGSTELIRYDRRAIKYMTEW